MFLFARNNAGSLNDYGACRIYECDIYNNNQIVRSFHPVRRKSDGVLGMYDSITGGFYTNSGSGSFVAGPTISAPVEVPLYNRWV